MCIICTLYKIESKAGYIGGTYVMRKRSMLLGCVACGMLLLVGCGGVKTETYVQLQSDYNELQLTAEQLRNDYDNLTEDYDELKEEYEMLK